MIADLDETIRQILVQEFPIRNGDIDIKFDQPKREWSSRLTKPTINFYLYDVRENAVLRQHQWERIAQGAQGTNGGSINRQKQVQLKRTPFRVDCFYMLTTWANEPEDEHQLLSNSLAALFRYPILPRDRLVGAMKEQPFDIQIALARHDRLTNPAEVWGALDNEIRPSVSMVVTLAIDPWRPITYPMARSAVIHTGQSEPRSRRITDGYEDRPIHIIAGTVTDRKNPDEVKAGVQVAIKGTGFSVTSDSQGRYRIHSLESGKYTLVAWPEKGKPVEKDVEVPIKEGDYDIQM